MHENDAILQTVQVPRPCITIIVHSSVACIKSMSVSNFPERVKLLIFPRLHHCCFHILLSNKISLGQHWEPKKKRNNSIFPYLLFLVAVPGISKKRGDGKVVVPVCRSKNWRRKRIWPIFCNKIQPSTKIHSICSEFFVQLCWEVEACDKWGRYCYNTVLPPHFLSCRHKQ